jgi:hypothetical protein
MNALTPITSAGIVPEHIPLAGCMVPELVADDDIVIQSDDGWDDPSWRGAALEYHAARDRRVSIVSHSPEEIARLRRLMDDNVSLDCAWSELSRPSRTAAPTVEALMFAMRSRGVQALGEPDVLHRLSQLDFAQMREVAIRLQKLKPHMASAWSPEDVQVLLTVRSKTGEQDA